ncbi:MAG: hypothetical protein RIM72_22030 [Alphaproteobacteria bacterium]
MSVIEKMKAERDRLVEKEKNLVAERDKVEGLMRDVRREMNEIDGALRVASRYDNSIDVPAVKDTPEFIFGKVKAEHVVFSNPPENKDEAPTCEEAMREMLLLHPGSKVGELIAFAKKSFGIEYNKKTAGNTLWRIKNEGDAKREGQKWYPEKKTPPTDAYGGIFKD